LLVTIIILLYLTRISFVKMEILFVMNSQLLIDLVDAALAADYTAVRRCAGALAAALEADGQHVAGDEGADAEEWRPTTGVGLHGDAAR